jgi:hypothetical protein
MRGDLDEGIANIERAAVHGVIANALGVVLGTLVLVWISEAVAPSSSRRVAT